MPHYHDEHHNIEHRTFHQRTRGERVLITERCRCVKPRPVQRHARRIHCCLLRSQLSLITHVNVSVYLLSFMFLLILGFKVIFMQINVNVYVYVSFLSFQVTTASQGLCLFVVLSSVFHVFHLVTIVNYCHPCHEWQKKSSLPGDSTAACSLALQSHFLLNILPRSCPRNLLKIICACICVPFFF